MITFISPAMNIEVSDFEKRSKEEEAKRLILKDVDLNVGILEGEDYLFDCGVSKVREKINPSGSYSMHVLGLLQQVLGFRVTFKAAASWGHFERFNGTWTGLAALLANNETDMNVCHRTADGYYAGISEFLTPTLETTESMVYSPEKLPLTQDVFALTFSHKLWIFFVASIFLIVASFKISTSMHSYIRPDHEPWSWDEVLLWAVAAVSQQSYARHPRGSSCRTMFLIGYSIAYLLYTGFAAGITSLLALQDHRNQLSLKDVNKMKLGLIFNNDEYPLNILNELERAGFDLLENKKKENLSKIFSDVKMENSVGLGSTVALLNYLEKKVEEKEAKSIVVVPVSQHKLLKAFLVRKSFPFKKVFNYWLLRLKETGLLDFGKKRFVEIGEKGSRERTPTSWLSASMGNVFSAFAFLGGGWLLSLFLLFLEIFTGKRKIKLSQNKPVVG